jgi:hypothetical protein
MNERGLDVVRFEPRVEHVCVARREELLQDRLQLGSAHVAEQLRERRWRPQLVRIDDARRLGPEGVPARVGLGVVSGESRDLFDVSSFVAVQLQVPAVRERTQLERLELEYLEAVLLHLEVVNDRRLERVAEERAGRKMEAGDQLLGRDRAADDLAPLEDRDAQAGAREIARRDEPVVAGADDDDIEVCGHECLLRMSWREPSERTGE